MLHACMHEVLRYNLMWSETMWFVVMRMRWTVCECDVRWCECNVTWCECDVTRMRMRCNKIPTKRTAFFIQYFPGDLRICTESQELKYVVGKTEKNEIKLKGIHWYRFYDPEGRKYLRVNISWYNFHITCLVYNVWQCRIYWSNLLTRQN